MSHRVGRLLAVAPQQGNFDVEQYRYDKSGGMIRRRVRILGIILLLCLCGAYVAARLGAFEWPREYDPLALPDLDAKPYWMQSWQMQLLDASGRNCQFALQHSQAVFTADPPQVAKAGCYKLNTVTLARMSSARLKPEETRCAIAARLYVWERNVVQPQALAMFHEPVTEVMHFGSYNCRLMRHGSTMSEHSTANAFDISGFKLKSGKIVSVLKDWRGTGPSSEFLHRVHDGLCDNFNLTLSPDYNADHKDHFHVDMGRWKRCR
jgi:hypothetical protein